MKNLRIKVDVAFVLILAITAAASLCGCAEPEPMGPTAITAGPTTQITTPETTEAAQETAQVQMPVTEATDPTEAPVTLYDIPLSQEVQLHIISEAESHGIDPAIVFAMAYRESNYNVGCVGDYGASLGLLQVQPYWHKERMERLGCRDLLDPFQNATVAIDYLSELLGQYGSMEKALVAYNRGHYSGTVTEYARGILNIAEGLRGEAYVLYLCE